MTGDLDRRIRERAYEIWENEGRPQGRSEEHWKQARAEFSDASSEAGQGTKGRKRGASGSGATAGKRKAAGGAGAGKSAVGDKKDGSGKAAGRTSRKASPTKRSGKN